MKKIIAALMLVTAFASCSWAWFVGSGTEDDPYVIANASDFSYFRYRVNNGLDDEGCYYLLSNDIQLTRQTLEAPVGILKVSSDLQTVMHDYSFKGHFDGNNHIIYVKILPFFEGDAENLANYDRALFGYVNTDGDYAVKNLRVGGYISGNFPAGIVSRLGSGRIEGCRVSADIDVRASSASEARSHHYIGAPTEFDDNTYAFGGGIVANMYGGEIVSCDFSGKVKTEEADFSHAGGIAGFIWATSALLQGCNVKHYATVTAKGDSASSGGIVGYLEVEDLASASGDVTVTGCTFEGGEISSDYSAGGIAGIVYGGILTDNTVGSDTRINGATYAGGIAGTLSAGALVSENNVEGGIVQADSRASGGIVGLLELGYIESNDAESSVQGDASYKGGVIGEIHNHYGSSLNVTGNTYAGAEFGVGIDEHLQMNQNIAGTTKQSATLSFLTPSRLPSVKEKENYSASIQLSVPAIIDISPIPTWLNPVQAGNIISMSCIPQTTGTFEFTLNATYGEQTASRTYSLTVNSKLSVNSTRDFPEYADLGAFFAYTFSANAGGEDISSLTWTASGDLPDGLILNPTAGRLSGNPTTEGEYTFEILANADSMSQASTGALTLKVAKAISIIADGAASRDNVVYLPTAMIDDDFRFALHIDQSGLTEQWYIQAGNFPSGLTIDESTGLIYGAPDTAGTYYFVVGVNAGTMSATQEMSMAILPALEISTSSLPAIRIDTPYTATISTNAVYGTPISWDITGLPEGLSYNASGLICTISGTVSEVERYTVTVQASYGSYSASKTFTLNAVRGFTILTDELPIGKTGYGYSFRLTTNAASSDAVAWSVIGGNLPNGTTLDSNTGRISGTPSASGSFDFTVQAVTSRDYTSKDLEIFISDKLVITTGSELKDAEISKDYSVQLMTNIGLTSGWTIEGGLLPDGLVLSSDGTIAGKPTEYGDFTFTLKVEAGGLEAWGDFMLTVLPSFYISTGENLGTAEVGKPYSRLLLTNRDTSSAKWYVVGGTFPEGLSLSRDKGLISGTPTVGTSYDFTVQAVSGVNTDEKRFSLVVKPALEIITPATLPPASRDYPYDYTISTDAKSAITWNFISGDIPSGIGFEDGTISGTPTEAGPFTFTLEALSDGKRSAKTFTLYVADYLEILTSPTLPSANEGVPYSYTLISNADDASAVRWYVISGDAPVEPETTTGLLSWTPSHDDVSDDAYVFEVQAVYGRLTASKVFTLTVEPVMSVVTPSVLREARVNSRYSYQLRADVNGATWEVSGGTLPNGLTLSGDVITGTPTTAGEYSFTVKASSGTISAVKTLTLKVGTELQILSSALKAAKVNEQYSHIFRTNKGNASWNVISGDFPNGITLDASTGVITGAALDAGSFDFTLQAKSGGLTASRDFTLTVNPELRITTNSVLPSARINTLYSYILATDSDMAITWNFMDYRPLWLTLSRDTGEILGIPTEAGEFSFTIQATAGDVQAEKEFTLTVFDEIAITTSTLPKGKLGADYSYTLATDATSPSSVIWTLASGDLPSGLILGRTTGKISGKPTIEGSFDFTVNAVLQTSAGRLTASAPFSINVYEEITELSIITDSLRSGVKGVEYTQTLETDAPSGTAISWDISGTLPEGLTFSNGIISGTPTETGDFMFTVQAMARTGMGRILSAHRTFTLTIEDTLKITTASSDVPSGMVGSPYSYTLTTNSMTPSSVKWFVSSGNLPTGLTLGGTTGKISGTPSAEGTYDFTVRAYVQTSAGRMSDDKAFSILVHSRDYEITELNITTSSLPAGMTGSEYSQTLETDAPSGVSVSWDISGTLPEGLTFSNGIISGTPTEAGEYSFTVQAMTATSRGIIAASRLLTLTVWSALEITTASLPSGKVDVPYSYTLAANTASSVTWSLSGDVPYGFSIARDTGRISGTPIEEGTFTFSVIASLRTPAGITRASRDFTITVYDEVSALNIITSSLLNGTAGSEYSQTIETDAPSGVNVSWDISGALPAGLTFAAGTISGTTTETGNFAFTVQAMLRTNSGQTLTATRTFTLTVMARFAITTVQSDIPSGKIGNDYSFTLVANSASSPAWSVIDGSLPAGLTLGRSTGTISGTPLASGDFTFTVQAVSGSSVASKDFTLTVDGSITIVTGETLPSAQEGEEYSQTLMADASATWSITAGKLPTGLALSSTGEISGTPSETGAFSFTVLAVSGTLTARKDFTLNVIPALVITTESLTSGREGSVYSVTLTAEPYSSSTTSWYKISGDLPAGMALNQSTGTISGTPSEHGTFTFRIAAIRGNFSAYRDFTLTVEAVLQITTPGALPGAVSGASYSYILMTNAAETDTVTWSAVSALPSGLSLDASTGEISGIPSEYGTFAFTVRADSGSAFDVKDFSLTVSSSSSLRITTNTLPSGTLGTQYSYTLAAGSSSGTLVWQIVSGDLPAGLTLNRSTGTIAGTPTLAETFTFTVEASSGGQSDRKSFTVTISPVLMITTGSLPSGKKDTAYSYTLALNTSESADWSVISGTLPEGLSLDRSSGEISGIPSNAGDSVFTLQAVSGGLTASKNFTLTISPVISITSSSDLPAGKVNSPYVFTLAADAGHTVSWSVISGALPQGLTLGTSTGVISGTPSAEGRFTFTVQVAEGTITSQKSFTLAINPVLNILTSSPLPNGKINTPYSLTFASDKASAAWSITSGDLPGGLALSSGTISGTPTEEGTFTFTLRAVYKAASSDKDFVLTIRPAMSIVTAETLPSAKTGQQYSYTLQTDATGLVPSWEIVSGDFPEGLSMDRMTGTISGTPSSEGTYSFNVQAKAGSITAVKEFMLTVEAAMSIVTSSVLPSASVSGNYTFTLTVDGGRAALWYLVGGSLPEGLTLDTATGVISGYTRAEGTYSFTVQAVSGALTAIKDFTLSVGTEIIIATPSALNSGSAGSSYSQTFMVNGGISAEWSVISGDVPQGLTLNARTGTLSGTPALAGSYAFTVQATSGYSSTVKTFTLDIALVISTSTLPNGTTGERYSHVLEAKGAAANTLTWSISADRVIPSSSQDVMPYGLTLAPDGVISGTPLQAGTFTFTVYVSGDNGLKADKMVRITIDSPSAVPITTVSLPNGKVSQDYHAELATTETGVTWKHTAGVLPPGLSLSESGLISGVPTQAGAFTFTVTASKGSQEGTRQLTLTIEPADEKKPESDDKGITTSSGGGGGCNSGGGLIGLMLAGITAFRKSNKK